MPEIKRMFLEESNNTKGQLLTNCDRKWVIFNKGGNKLLVTVSDMYMLAISLTQQVRKGVPLVTYVYTGPSNKEVYEHYLHFLGKMCLKKEDSKYFGSPIFEEHCINGRPGDISLKEWENLAILVVNRVNRQLDS